ncbi:hypothetical protein ACQPVP_06920 [Clostridium nigeriense]|uniref:hypothetical protein n=1 Tax=Clostridium nigeriense TaxID=1805470 RepID=UPI003D345F16
MKKNIKYLIFILLACCIFILSPFNKKAATMNDERLNFVNEQITLLSDSLEESSWDSSSEIYNVIPLYDLDDNINGYIYEIRTNGKGTGFIQIDISTGDNVVSSFSFDGNHAINSMISQNEKISNQNLEEIDKIIHIGGYNYLFETKDGKQNSRNLFDLRTGEKVTESLETIKNKYTEEIEIDGQEIYYK